MNLDFRCEMALEGARTYEAAHQHGHVCGECRFAQVFAVQPRAACAASGIENAGRVVSVTRPACRHYVARPANDIVMAQFLAEPAAETKVGAATLTEVLTPHADPAPTAIPMRWVARDRTAALR